MGVFSITANKPCPQASHGTGKICKANRYPFSSAYKTTCISRLINKHRQGVFTL